MNASLRSEHEDRPGTPPRFQISDLGPEDLPWVAAREKDIFGTAAWSEDLIVADFANGGRRYRGIRDSGRLVGYAVFGFDGDAFSLLNLAVIAGDRRRGAARALVEDFLHDARNVGVAEGWLEVAATNAAAIALYRKFGFEDVRVRPRYYQPGDVDALVMRVSL